MPSSHLILCRPLLLLPLIPPSIRVFSNESSLRMRWPEYWTFSFSIIPSKEIPGLISFRMDCLDFLAVQGTLKSLLQHHSSKASVLRCSGFFTVQLSYPYMTTGVLCKKKKKNFLGFILLLLIGVKNYTWKLLGAKKRHLHFCCCYYCCYYFNVLKEIKLINALKSEWHKGILKEIHYLGKSRSQTSNLFSL